MSESVDVTASVSPAPPPEESRPAEWPTFMVALLSGESMYGAARKAKISRRTAARWRAKYGSDLLDAEKKLAALALKELSLGLVAAARRLRTVAESSVNEATGVAASKAIFAAHNQLMEETEVKAQLANVNELLGKAKEFQHTVPFPQFRSLLGKVN